MWGCPINSKNSRILILGLAYKPDIDDTRESPAFKLIELLLDKGAIIDYSDPYVASIPKKRDYAFKLDSVDLSVENIKSYDCLILVTNHQKFDYDLLQKNAQLIIDARGVYSDIYDNVVKA